MHTYSTDNENRPRVYGVIALLAYGLAATVGLLVSTVASAAPIVAGIGISWGIAFKVLLTLFDTWVWNTRPSRLFGAAHVPDFNGEWEGYIKTSYEGEIDPSTLHPVNDPDGDLQAVSATLDIDQTWRKINVHLSTETSASDSEGATVLTKEGKWPNLSYQYGNNPNVSTEETMHHHYGTADLVRKETADGAVLEGPYYTGPGRENYGEMHFKRSGSQ